MKKNLGFSLLLLSMAGCDIFDAPPGIGLPTMKISADSLQLGSVTFYGNGGGAVVTGVLLCSVPTPCWLPSRTDVIITDTLISVSAYAQRDRNGACAQEPRTVAVPFGVNLPIGWVGTLRAWRADSSWISEPLSIGIR